MNMTDNFNIIQEPPTTLIVTIPKDGKFCIHYSDDIGWWARMWMRFIGWGVTKP